MNGFSVFNEIRYFDSVQVSYCGDFQYILHQSDIFINGLSCLID